MSLSALPNGTCIVIDQSLVYPGGLSHALTSRMINRLCVESATLENIGLQKDFAGLKTVLIIADHHQRGVSTSGQQRQRYVMQVGNQVRNTSDKQSSER